MNSSRLARFLSVACISCVMVVSALVAPAAGARPPVNHYFGILHAHTAYSDGALTPSDAFTHARDVAGLDFLATTEHGYYMQEETNIILWHKSLEEAEEFYEPGVFVPFIGFEWTHSSGHAGGYGTPLAASRDNQRSLAELIEFLAMYDGFGMFNHPDYELQPNWDDFAYSGRADRYMCLLEVGNGPYSHNIRNERAYIRALDRGWKVGATSNQDNHRADWGTAADTRTAVLAWELTREAVYDALRSMRTYATEDRNVRVIFESDDVLIGGTVTLSAPDLLRGVGIPFTIRIDDPDPDDCLDTVQVIGSGGKVVMEFAGPGCGHFEVTFDIVPEESYNWYYVRAVQKDKDVIVTSPIWVASEADITVCDFAVADPMVTEGVPTRVLAEVVNRNDSPLQRVEAHLYVTRPGARDRLLVGSTVVSVPAGAGTEVRFEWVPDAHGDAGLEMEIVIPGGAAPERFIGKQVRVHPAGLPKVLVDEGHNNRYSGYLDAFLDLLRAHDYDARSISARITADLLADYDVLVITLPEVGFSLGPTAFEDAELDAVVSFVRDGGALLLGAWSFGQDGSRSVSQFNEILEGLGAPVRFGYDEIRHDAKTQVKMELSSGGTVYVSEACALAGPEFGALPVPGMQVLARAPGSATNVDLEGEGRYYPYARAPVVAASFEVGLGRVVCVGAPTFSSHDLVRPGFENSAFTLGVMEWLARRELMRQ
ncbi:MAG: CehA/McbA family metallohydrolase [Firmicutes bacterium]|nr:CehA/McbA family metallohydrolase [Bacillota bacterium]